VELKKWGLPSFTDCPEGQPILEADESIYLAWKDMLSITGEILGDSRHCLEMAEADLPAAAATKDHQALWSVYDIFLFLFPLKMRAAVLVSRD
jgi:hypothetical protein